MSTKISALSTGTTANATDKIPIERAGANAYITPAMVRTYVAGTLGLLARYRNSANITVTTAGVPIVDFNTMEYDPLSLVTTGASWAFTAPVTAWYTFEVENFFINPNGAGYSANDAIFLHVYKNGATLTGTASIVYWDAGDAVATTSHWPFLAGSLTFSMAAGDTANVRIDNSTSGTRLISAHAGVCIYRVT